MSSAIHNLSHSVKQTGRPGQLMPITCFDVVPGDKVNHKITALLRTQPLLAPLMHLVDVDIHAYYSPDRLAWDNSEDFHSGGDDGQDASVAPYMLAPVGGYQAGSLADYLGLPLGVTGLKHSALPFRHYALIYNHHYRDSQIQPEIAVSTADGLDTTTSTLLLNAAWKRDYFNSARPEPQLGAEVVIPLTGDAPVVGTGTAFRGYTTAGDQDVALNTTTTRRLEQATNAAGTFKVSQTNSGMEADLSAVTGIPIRELREAGATQRHLEFNNIWGGRYIEQIMARWGVRVPDYRLQIPEYLGSGHTKIQFSEVIQTAEGVDPVGTLRGHGISIIGSNRYKYKVQEHGWVMVFMIVRPKTQYMQGLHRSWSRETKFDYLLPEFQDIGDQAVLNKELLASHSQPNGVHGFQQMFEEYRTIPSRVAGLFRTTEKHWHMAREFSGDTALNSTFIACNPTTRVWPAPNEDSLYFNIEHAVQCRRKLRNKPAYLLK